MATQTITLSQKGSGNSTMQLRVTYNPGKNGFTVTKYEGYRTNYNTYSGTDATLNLILNGTYYGVTCRPYAGNYYWNNFWSGSLWVNQAGGYLEFTVSGGNNANWKNSWFQTDLASYSIYLRLKTMDCYGNYGSATLWQSWSSPGGYSGTETAYESSSIYNSASWSSTGVWSNVDYTLNCSRKKTNFALSCVNESGVAIPFNAEFSDDNGTSYTNITENPYSTQYVERPYRIKNITSNGYKIDKIMVNNTEITPLSDGTYSFSQSTSATSVKIYMVKSSGISIKIKNNGEWISGVPYVKSNDSWILASGVYIKKDGNWKQSG